MRRDLVLGGLGGQGIVISSKLVGAAAMKAGLYATHYSAYSGEVRGGWVECTLAVDEQLIQTPPMVGLCQAAVIMHPSAWDRTLNRLEPGGLLIVNASLVDREDFPQAAGTVLRIPATEIGERLGAEMAGAMVVLGAYIEATGLVEVEAVKQLLEEVLPPYRHNLLQVDREALTAGAQYAAQRLSAAGVSPVGVV